MEGLVQPVQRCVPRVQFHHDGGGLPRPRGDGDLPVDGDIQDGGLDVADSDAPSGVAHAGRHPLDGVAADLRPLIVCRTLELERLAGPRDLKVQACRPVVVLRLEESGPQRGELLQVEPLHGALKVQRIGLVCGGDGLNAAGRQYLSLSKIYVRAVDEDAVGNVQVRAALDGHAVDPAVNINGQSRALDVGPHL